MAEFAAPPAGGAHGPGTAGDPVPAVVIVPDDDLRLLVRGLLSLEHHPILLEGTGREVLRRYVPRDPRTLLVVDAAAIGEDGPEWLAELTRAHPELHPVVLVPSGTGDQRSTTRVLPGCAVVTRPVVLAEFVAALGRALHPDRSESVDAVSD